MGELSMTDFINSHEIEVLRLICPALIKQISESLEKLDLKPINWDQDFDFLMDGIRSFSIHAQDTKLIQIADKGKFATTDILMTGYKAYLDKKIEIRNLDDYILELSMVRCLPAYFAAKLFDRSAKNKNLPFLKELLSIYEKNSSQYGISFIRELRKNRQNPTDFYWKLVEFSREVYRKLIVVKSQSTAQALTQFVSKNKNYVFVAHFPFGYDLHIFKIRSGKVVLGNKRQAIPKKMLKVLFYD
jgi:hypothetical protein